MKHVPNLLSALRILLSPVLIATADRPPLLAALMLLAGATDAVDGIIARRFDCQTRLGARLDSVADWTFFLALGWVFCTRYESVVRSCLTELVVVLALRLAAIVVGWLRFRRLLSVHTLGNKISAVIAFVLLVRIVWCGPVSATALRIALLFAALTALEELLIIVRSRTPDPNQRTLFGKR
jgi:CDP-alcohol phosphatidyltransferase